MKLGLELFAASVAGGWLTLALLFVAARVLWRVLVQW